MPGEHGPLRRPETASDPRAAAESAIERALAVLETAPAPSVDQLSDLADAIDSLKEGAFAVAADLAGVAQSSRTLPTARRPQNLARSLPDLKAAFGATRKFLRATPTNNSA
jgi:hypothetical protein